MEIQLGTIYMNQTKKYLLPCLKDYGVEFSQKMGNLFKLAIGIGDFALIDMGIKLEKHIFILIDTNLSRKHFNSTMNWLRLQEYFSFDYPFDDIHKGHLHMVAVKIPEKFHKTLGKFRDGQFSEMYNYEDLELYFKGKDQELKVLTKDKIYKVEFVEKVNELYKTNINPDTWTGELDFPINLKNENF